MSIEQAIAINEKQALAYLYKYPSAIFDLEKNFFTFPLTKDLFETFKELIARDMEVTTDHLITVGSELNYTFEYETLNNIFSQKFTIESWKDYKKRLKNEYAKKEISEFILEEILVESMSETQLDIEKVESLSLMLNENLELLRGDENVLLSGEELMTNYEQEIRRRHAGLLYAYGDPLLDSAIVTGALPGEITTIFAATGVGKSTFGLNLVNKHIHRNLPIMYFTLEMSRISTMDRLIALRNTIPIKSLYPDSDGEISQEIYSILKKERRRLSRSKRFFMVDKDGLGILELESLIASAKKRMKLKKKEVLKIIIDLATMLQEFSGEDAKNYEKGMNMLSALAKRQDVHLILIVQAGRSADNVKLSDINQLDKLRPTLNDIKNSNAIGERSRVVVSAFRRKYYAERLFPQDPTLEFMEDIYELQVLKQSNGQVGRILRYLLGEGTFQLRPILTETEYIEMLQVENDARKALQNNNEEALVEG